MSLDVLITNNYTNCGRHRMARSEYDENSDPPSDDETVLDKTNDTTIHSGHFMLSRVHNNVDDDGDEHTEPTDLPEREKEPPNQYDFTGAAKEPVQSYDFGGNNPIDASLNKLFQCMTLAYRFVNCKN